MRIVSLTLCVAVSMGLCLISLFPSDTHTHTKLSLSLFLFEECYYCSIKVEPHQKRRHSLNIPLRLSKRLLLRLDKGVEIS